MRRGLTRVGAPALAAALAAASLSASTVRIWVCDTSADFSLGEARGISVTADGALVAGRSLAKVDGISEAVLFGAAAGKGGELYVGTGDSGRILRVSSSGAVDIWATLPEQEVTALVVGPDGAVYAGGSPGGKVYRVENGKAAVYYETKAQYVWALAFSGPVLYVATGLPGEIHRVRTSGQGERVYATTDAHVRSLYRRRRRPCLGRHVRLRPRAADRQDRPRVDDLRLLRSPRSPRSRRTPAGGSGRPPARRTCPPRTPSRSRFPSWPPPRSPRAAAPRRTKRTDRSPRSP